MERYATQIKEGVLSKVGVNAHQIPEEEDTLLREVTEKKIEPCWERIEIIKAFKEERDRDAIAGVLRDVRNAAGSEKENLMYPVIAATEAGATMGEIAGAMRLAYDYPYDPQGMIESPF